MIKDILHQSYGYLFEPELLQEIEKVAVYRKVDQGDMLMDIGQTITHMPLLLTGAIKILREDAKGDELILYYIERGDTCTLTFSCCMGSSKSEIRAIAETNTELLMIPVEKMEIWMGKYRFWRSYILESYHIRVKELLETVDTLAFMRMDERLLRHLRDRAKVNQDEVIATTHQDIAYDLNTSRVVVSRLLKKLEKEGRITLHRNRIKVLEL
ncbi:MAG: Crp/Fnr family transcriptional regulator [Bacteroidota bacterium]